MNTGCEPSFLMNAAQLMNIVSPPPPPPPPGCRAGKIFIGVLTSGRPHCGLCGKFSWRQWRRLRAAAPSDASSPTLCTWTLGSVALCKHRSRSIWAAIDSCFRLFLSSCVFLLTRLLQLHPAASECLPVSSTVVLPSLCGFVSPADVAVPPTGPNFTPRQPLYLGGVE